MKFDLLIRYFSVVLLINLYACHIKPSNYIVYFNEPLELGKFEGSQVNTEKEVREEGLWKVSSENLAMEGRFDEGYRVGNWNYSFMDSSQFSVEWQFVGFQDQRMTVNTPVKWQGIKNANNFITFLLDKDSISEHDFLTIRKFDRDQFKGSFELFLKIAVDEFQTSGWKVKQLEKYYFEIESNKYQYLGAYVRTEELWVWKLFLLMDFQETNDFLLITYSNSRENEMLNKVIFTGVVTGSTLHGKKLVNSLEGVSTPLPEVDIDFEIN